jgi:hypothetical protein
LDSRQTRNRTSKNQLTTKVILLTAKLTRAGWDEPIILGYLKDLHLQASQKKIRVVIQQTKKQMREEAQSGIEFKQYPPGLYPVCSE